MIQFELVTLDGVKHKDSAHEVLLPTPDGQIGIFDNHAPLVSMASSGIISVRHKSNDPDDFMDHFAVSGGVIEIVDNTVRVLVDEAAHADEISEADAKEAHLRALKLKAEAKDIVSLDKAQSLVDRESTRLKVAGMRRHRKTKFR